MTLAPGRGAVHRESDVTITELGGQPDAVRRQAAALLVEDFDDHPRGWPDLEAATEKVSQVLR